MINVKGKTVVITGSFPFADRTAIKKALIAQGATVAGSVNAKVDILFAGHAAGSKLTKAEALGITVHQVAELFNVMGQFDDIPMAVCRDNPEEHLALFGWILSPQYLQKICNSALSLQISKRKHEELIRATMLEF